MSDTTPLLPQHDRVAALRILDANQNRAVEALRVVEEYARFVQNDAPTAGLYKQLRHDLVTAIAASLPMEELLRARDTVHDVGTQIETATEYQRTDLVDVVAANLKRLEQALRAIEEYGKVISPQHARAVEQIRYRAYDAAKILGGAMYRCQQLASARLYVLLDGSHCLDTFANRAEQVVAGGADILQLRDKQLSDRELLARARVLRSITRGRALFIMNDRPDLAELSDADGVHLGQDELSVADARQIVGARRLIGISTHNRDQARQAVRDGADYIGCGPTFPSTTKSFPDFPGIPFLQQVAAEIRLPAFAIGGIALDNIAEVKRAGIERVAVSGAISQSSDPMQATQQLRSALGE